MYCYAECHYAECRDAECHGALETTRILLKFYVYAGNQVMGMFHSVNSLVVNRNRWPIL